MNVRHKLAASALAILLLTTACQASESKVNAFVKGSINTIQQQNSTTPHIVLFWSQDCAYCMKELSFLGDNLRHYPKVKLITVSTDAFLAPERVDELLEQHGLTKVEKWVFSEKVVQKLYYDVEPKWRGELPFMLFSDGKSGNVIRKRGYVEHADFIAWLEHVSAANH